MKKLKPKLTLVYNTDNCKNEESYSQAVLFVNPIPNLFKQNKSILHKQTKIKFILFNTNEITFQKIYF